MQEKIKKLIMSEGMMYIIVGVMTTVVNFVIFTGFNEVLKRTLSETVAYKIAYVVAFIVAVIFAYWTNKFYVFKNHNMDRAYLIKEFTGFMSARVFSGVVTFLLMILCVDFIKMNPYIAWLITTVFNLVFNYLASKFWIFKK